MMFQDIYKLSRLLVMAMQCLLGVVLRLGIVSSGLIALKDDCNSLVRNRSVRPLCLAPNNCRTTAGSMVLKTENESMPQFWKFRLIVQCCVS